VGPNPPEDARAGAVERGAEGAAVAADAEQFEVAIAVVRRRQRLELARRHQAPTVSEQAAGIETGPVNLLIAGDAENFGAIVVEGGGRQDGEASRRERAPAAQQIRLRVEPGGEDPLPGARRADAEHDRPIV